jgi:hypothetical protein
LSRSPRARTWGHAAARRHRERALYGPDRDDVTGVDLGRMVVRWDAEEPENGGLAWAILERYNEATRGLARGEGVCVIDLARRLPKSTRFFYDFVHFTNDGAAAVAALIDEELCPFLSERHPGHATRPCASLASLPDRPGPGRPPAWAPCRGASPQRNTETRRQDVRRGRLDRAT